MWLYVVWLFLVTRASYCPGVVKTLFGFLCNLVVLTAVSCAIETLIIDYRYAIIWLLECILNFKLYMFSCSSVVDWYYTKDFICMKYNKNDRDFLGFNEKSTFRIALKIGSQVRNVQRVVRFIDSAWWRM